MKNQDFHPAIGLLPSFTDLAFLAPVLFLFARLEGAATLLNDGDTGWHLRTGQWMLANGQVPHTDPFSFTRPGQPWYAWEWLWDLIFGWLHQAAGMQAVVWISTLMLACASAMLFRLIRRRCGNVLVAIAITLMAVMATAVHWLARPHLVTLLFVLIFFRVLERAREGSPRMLFWLPPLMVLWTNLHGGFLAGLMLIAGFAAGEAAAAMFQPQASLRAVWTRVQPFVLAGSACALATFANPYGYHLHLHIARYLSDPYLFKHIAEFRSLSFQQPVARYFECMLLLGSVASFRNFARRRFTDGILTLMWGHLALYSARNIPLFALVAAPAIAEMCDEWIRTLVRARLPRRVRAAALALHRKGREMASLDEYPRLHVASAAVLTLVALLLYAPVPPKPFQARYVDSRYPEAAIRALGSGLGERVFSDDEWGDYLIYARYPAGKVYIDGRSDFYGEKFGKEVLDVLGVRYGWESHLNRYGVDTVLLSPDVPLAGTLKESSRWRVVYDDGVAIAFRRVNPGGGHGEAATQIARSQPRSAHLAIPQRGE